MFLVQSHMIPHLQLGFLLFTGRMFAVQSFPHLLFVVGIRFLRCHLDEVTIQTFLQRAIESFHDATFGVTACGKMMNVFSFHQRLKHPVVKFFAVIHLQFERLASIAPFQNFFEGCCHVFSRLGLDGFHPSVL